MRAEFLTQYPSPQTRVVWPEGIDIADPRTVEMADFLREAAGAGTGAAESDLIGAGFTRVEIAEYAAEAAKLAGKAFVRQVRPGDRIAAIIEKAVAAAAHAPPQLAGDPPDGDGEADWRRYCRARAAYKLDPWVSQGERTLALLKRVLVRLDLSEREQNRVVFAIAASQRAEASRGRQ